MQNKDTKFFWHYEASQWLEWLKSSESGLTEETAQRIYQSSSARYKGKSAFRKDIELFLNQFKSPLMLLLIGAVILSAFLGDGSDVLIILFIILSTSILSFLQERNAGRIVEKLQRMISRKANVLRGGKMNSVAADAVVPGDILLLKAGDIVPGDCIVVEANELYVNEASLTGESFPVRKEPGKVETDTELAKRTNCLWEGTNVISGTAKALVIHTGADTIFGGIIQSSSTSTETSFEKGIKDFGYFLMRITLTLSVFILVVNLLQHESVIESTLFALALAVGMAPELLPAITTIAMSAGAKRMLKKKVIVKKLASIQNLGEVNLLCTDKTGTITEGIIQVNEVVDSMGKESSFVKQLAFWNAAYETGYSNPIDDALKQLPIENAIPATKTGEIPYDFIRKRLSIAVDTGNKTLLISKGAFIQIVQVCSHIRMADGSVAPFEMYRSGVENRFTQYGQQGYRVIAVAYKNIEVANPGKEEEKQMTFAGFVLLHDPVKEGINVTIARLSELQIDLKIITGDNRNIARTIALSIGIANPKVMTGSELLSTDALALRQRVKDVHIFAEVEPQQKESIIQALRRSYTVAYMGDGINDVAALNAADVGISVDNAVDAAKETADFVLLEKDLSVMIDGIREGRKTFANTLKYIYISTGSTFGNMCSVAFASLILPFLPMLPKQLLLTNFITDLPYLMVASDNVDEEQLEKPGKWRLKVIRNYMIIFGIHSSMFDIITFLTLLFVLKVKESVFQTGWFVESVLSELFILFIIRTHKSFFKSQPGKYLFLLSVSGLILTIALPYLPFAHYIGLVPLPATHLGAMLLIVLAYIITADLLKVWFFRHFQKTRS